MNYQNDFTQGQPAPQTPPVQPTQPQGYTQQPAIQPPNTATFNLDTKTREILSSVHPELLNALVNIAIKKFSTDSDFINYFVRDEFKHIAEAHQEQIQPDVGQTGSTKTSTQSTPAANKSMDFTGW